LALVVWTFDVRSASVSRDIISSLARQDNVCCLSYDSWNSEHIQSSKLHLMTDVSVHHHCRLSASSALLGEIHFIWIGTGSCEIHSYRCPFRNINL